LCKPELVVLKSHFDVFVFASTEDVATAIVGQDNVNCPTVSTHHSIEHVEVS
jgi:hypothetical protein